ncbi:MAG: hypothetical protein ACI835_005723 [Planctomycetota bacterium]|jgi:hypothetical protein
MGSPIGVPRPPILPQTPHIESWPTMSTFLSRRLLGVMHLLAGVVFLLLGSCAATSNLDERPPWAMESRLPSAHPLASQYDEEDYFLVVGLGTGASVVGAGDVAAENGEQALRKALVRATSAAGQAGGLEGAEAYQGRVEALASEYSDRMLSQSSRIITWDGFEDETKYFYGLYALEKRAAADIALNIASERYDQLSALTARIDQAGDDPAAEPLALEAMARIQELRVLKQTVASLGHASGARWIDDFSELEVTCAEDVHAAGRRREAVGQENDLREALAFYREAARCRPDPLLDQAIARVENRLPCGDCKQYVSESWSQLDALEDLNRRMEGVTDPAQRGRLAVEAVSGAAMFKNLCAHPHAFYAERVGQINEFVTRSAFVGDLDQRAVKIVYECGEHFERQGTEASLEEALGLYSRCSAYRPDRVLDGRILEVKRQLPCTTCGHSNTVDPGVCTHCDGSRGANYACSRCNSSQFFRGNCSGCSGDGLDDCGNCSTRGWEWEDCRDCSGGEVTCFSCDGQGHSGGGSCMSCSGSGTFGFYPNEMVCFSCSGSGREMQITCFGCGGDGDQTCGYCDGDARVQGDCHRCNGDGRSGNCPTCGGARVLDYPCDSCRDGTEWHNCGPCNGAGKCSTCSGSGHRA